MNTTTTSQSLKAQLIADMQSLGITEKNFSLSVNPVKASQTHTIFTIAITFIQAGFVYDSSRDVCVENPPSTNLLSDLVRQLHTSDYSTDSAIFPGVRSIVDTLLAERAHLNIKVFSSDAARQHKLDWVSSDGKHRVPGSPLEPYATLQDARDEIEPFLAEMIDQLAYADNGFTAEYLREGTFVISEVSDD